MARRSLTTQAHLLQGVVQKEFSVKGSTLAVSVLAEYPREGWVAVAVAVAVAAAAAVVPSLPQSAVLEALAQGLGVRGWGAGALVPCASRTVLTSNRISLFPPF